MAFDQGKTSICCASEACRLGPTLSRPLCSMEHNISPQWLRETPFITHRKLGYGLRWTGCSGIDSCPTSCFHPVLSNSRAHIQAPTVSARSTCSLSSSSEVTPLSQPRQVLQRMFVIVMPCTIVNQPGTKPFRECLGPDLGPRSSLSGSRSNRLPRPKLV